MTRHRTSCRTLLLALAVCVCACKSDVDESAERSASTGPAPEPSAGGPAAEPRFTCPDNVFRAVVEPHMDEVIPFGSVLDESSAFSVECEYADDGLIVEARSDDASLPARVVIDRDDQRRPAEFLIEALDGSFSIWIGLEWNAHGLARFRHDRDNDGVMEMDVKHVWVDGRRVAEEMDLDGDGVFENRVELDEDGDMAVVIQRHEDGRVERVDVERDADGKLVPGDTVVDWPDTVPSGATAAVGDDRNEPRWTCPDTPVRAVLDPWTPKPIRPRGAADDEPIDWHCEYDDSGRIVAVSDKATGEETSIERAADGRPLSVTRLLSYTAYHWDDDGRLAGWTRRRSVHSTGIDSRHTIRYLSHGRVESSCDPSLADEPTYTGSDRCVEREFDRTMLIRESVYSDYGEVLDVETRWERQPDGSVRKTVE